MRRKNFTGIDLNAPNPSLAAEPVASAARALGELGPGCWKFILTKGQYSLLDMLRAVIDQIGPSDVRLSTWTIGINDADAAAWLIRSGDIKSLQIFTDASLPSRAPAYAARLVALFGEEAVIATRMHAKIALISNGKRKIVIRSSMNLNRNPRFEQADVNDCPKLYDWIWKWFDVLEAECHKGMKFKNAEARAVFKAAVLMPESEQEIRAAVKGLTGSDIKAPNPLKGEMVGTGGDVDLARMDPAEIAEWLLHAAGMGVSTAAPGSVAYVQSIREIRTAHAEMMAIRAATGAAQIVELTDAQVLAKLQSEVGTASDEQLEVCAVEWASRLGYKIDVDDRGVVYLNRRIGA